MKLENQDSTIMFLFAVTEATAHFLIIVFICFSFFANETGRNVCELVASLVTHTVNTSDF